MCGPLIGVVTSIAGGVMSAAGASYNAAVERNQYKAQAAALRMQSKAERSRGRFDAGREQEQGRKLMGAQLVAYASEGLDLSGSVSDVISDSIEERELDIGAIKANSENRARITDYEAKVADMNAKAAKQAGKFAVANAIIGGIGGAASAFSGTSMFGGTSGTVGSAFTRGIAPGGLGTPVARPIARPVGSVTAGGNIPAYGYSYYGGPR